VHAHYHASVQSELPVLYESFKSNKRCRSTRQAHRRVGIRAGGASGEVQRTGDRFSWGGEPLMRRSDSGYFGVDLVTAATGAITSFSRRPTGTLLNGLGTIDMFRQHKSTLLGLSLDGTPRWHIPTAADIASSRIDLDFFEGKLAGSRREDDDFVRYRFVVGRGVIFLPEKGDTKCRPTSGRACRGADQTIAEFGQPTSQKPGRHSGTSGDYAGEVAGRELKFALGADERRRRSSAGTARTW